MFLLSGAWEEGQGAPSGAADETRRNLCHCLLSLAPGTPASPGASVTWLLWARCSLLAPPDTVPSLGYHTPQPECQGQERVNANAEGLRGRKGAVPTRLRCPGERPL